MGHDGYKHVSRLVPKSPKVLSALLILAAIVNPATMGYDSSMMNGLSVLTQYTEYFHLNTATTGLNNAGVWIGAVLSCLFMQPVPDRFGRKNAIYASIGVSIIGIIMQTAAQNIATFVIGRIIIGLGTQLAGAAAPTLLGEILPAARRGVVLGLFFSCYYIGSLLAAGINYRIVEIETTWAWRIPSVIQVVPSLISLALLSFLPESPRWLIFKGRVEEAREILTIVHGHSDVNSDETLAAAAEISAVLKREQELYPSNPWKELLSTKANQKRMFIMASFGIMVEFFGNFVISYYLGDMLTQAGITNAKTQLQVNIILNCWSFVLAVAGSFLLDVIGRRKQALIAVAGMTVTQYIFGGLSKVYGTSSNNSGIYGSIAVIFLFQGFYALAITPLTTLYPPEILPFKIRTAGIAVFRFFDCGFGLLASFTMSYAMVNLRWKFYLINASWNILFFAIIYLTWVETARVPLEEVALKFGDLDEQYIAEGDLSHYQSRPESLELVGSSTLPKSTAQ